MRLHGVVLEELLKMQDIAFLREVAAGALERNGDEFVVIDVRVLKAIAESLRCWGRFGTTKTFYGTSAHTTLPS